MQVSLQSRHSERMKSRPRVVWSSRGLSPEPGVKKGKGKPTGKPKGKPVKATKSPIPAREVQPLAAPETPPVNDLPADSAQEYRCPLPSIEELELPQRFYGVDRRMWPDEERDCAVIDEACRFFGLDFESDSLRLCTD